jgi:hypothetical protein
VANKTKSGRIDSAAEAAIRRRAGGRRCVYAKLPRLNAFVSHYLAIKINWHGSFRAKSPRHCAKGRNGMAQPKSLSHQGLLGLAPMRQRDFLTPQPLAGTVVGMVALGWS